MGNAISLSFGSRLGLTMGLAGGFIILNSSIPFRIISKIKLIILGAVSLIIIILGKSFYANVLFYGVYAGKFWLDNFSTDYFLIGSEFMSTSAILNAVIESNFEVFTESILKSFLALLPLPLAWFNFSSSSFNDAFQPLLFPGINYGMAYNPWAEAFAWCGYLGVFLYALTICLLLDLLWKIYSKNGTSLFSILILMVGLVISLWAHRNSLASVFANIRNIIYPLLFIYIASKITAKIFSKGSASF